MANTLQTLERGLAALDLIAQHGAGLSVAELAEKLEVHRAIAYRIVSTLEARALVNRSGDGQLRLGPGLVQLAARFEPQLRTLAAPLLHELARESGATAFISVAQGEECVVIMVAEPENTLLRVAYRVGSRHPLSVGAAGIAILAARPPRPDDPPALLQARRDGFSITRGQLQRGAVGVASAIGSRHDTGLEASLGVVAMDELDTRTAAQQVSSHARRLAQLLS